MIDDTILTAYALNELNATDRAAVETYLANNPSAKQIVADIQATASLLSDELAGELQATPMVLPIQLPLRHRSRWAIAAIGLAAAAALAAGLGVYVQQREHLFSGSPGIANSQMLAHGVHNAIPRLFEHAPSTQLAQAGVAQQQPSVTTSSEGSIKLNKSTRRSAAAAQGEVQQASRLLDHEIAGLIQDAREYYDKGKYQESLAVVDNIHRLDPTNTYANDVRQMVEDRANNQTQRKSGQDYDRESGRVINDLKDFGLVGNAGISGANGPVALRDSAAKAADGPRILGESDAFSKANSVAMPRNTTSVLDPERDKLVVYEDATRYSPDAPKISQMRARETAFAHVESIEDAALPPMLDRHLPELHFNQNSLSDVVDFMRDVSGSNINVDWQALEKSGLKKDTPVTTTFHDIKLSKALELILKSAGNGNTNAGYKLQDGTICISVGPDYRLENPIVTTNGESYFPIVDNPFLVSKQSPLSTFAVDVDTASYANVRRFIEQGQLPPANAVRVEELINYFPYETPGPKVGDSSPINVNVEVTDCPWQPAHQLARVALKAKSLPAHKRPPSNLVFLIDISGSMADENKLPLLKTSLKKLVNRLSVTDRVSIVTYASTTQVLLPSMACGDDPVVANADTTQLWHDVYAPKLVMKNGVVANLDEVTAAYKVEAAKLQASSSGRQQILSAIDSLSADGSTDGGDGIQLAYNIAVQNFNKEGTNRVILATDGDFNVGIVDPTQLAHLIEKEAGTGVYLTVLGVGMGNVKDSTMEKLADHGKGNYAYLDSVDEADKVLGRQIDSTLVTVARDVKLQIEFNPATVAAYRLIGYEDRAMANKDFTNDKKGAGEMGAGHSVTALYELVPTDHLGHTVALKYQPAPTTNPTTGELMTVNVRYQLPEGGESTKLEFPVTDDPEASSNTSSDFRFSAAVASFGMILRNSPYRGGSTLDQVIDVANASKGEDVGGYRNQFVELVKRTRSITAR